MRRAEFDGKRAGMRAPRRQALFNHGRAVVALSLIAFAAYGSMIPAGSIFSALNSRASAQVSAVAKVGAPAPDMAFTTVDGAERRLSEFSGRPVMLWLFATWCPTCKSGTIAVAGQFDRLKEAGIQIIQLKLYNNLGYQGPSTEQFAERYAGSVAPSPSWLWGDATLQGSFTYDPQGYPDIYFLIDKEGIIQTIAPAPNVTMDKILDFARSVQ